jgi:hypothetical protein
MHPGLPSASGIDLTVANSPIRMNLIAFPKLAVMCSVIASAKR